MEISEHILKTKPIASGGQEASSTVRQILTAAADQPTEDMTVAIVMEAAKLVDKIKDGTGDLILKAEDVVRLKQAVVKVVFPYISRQILNILDPSSTIKEDSDLSDIIREKQS